MHIIYTHARFITFISLLCIYTTTMLPSAIGILIGDIEFPHLKELPGMRLWFEGQIVATETHDNTISYRIPTSRHQEYYFLLFMDKKPKGILKATNDNAIQQNTIDYWMVPEDVHYRIFELHRIGNEWTVIERLLPLNRRIPDSTIIVKCPASHVEAVTGGNKFKLPSIIIKPNIIDLAGSEEKLKDSAIEMLIASLDCDALHVPMKEHIKITGNHVLIKPAA